MSWICSEHPDAKAVAPPHCTGGEFYLRVDKHSHYASPFDNSEWSPEEEDSWYGHDCPPICDIPECGEELRWVEETESARRQ